MCSMRSTGVFSMLKTNKTRNGRQIVNDKVDNMVAKNICAAKIVVNGEAEIGKWPGKSLLFQSEERIFDLIPGERLDVYVVIIDNISMIIKVPCIMEAVGINNY